MKSRMALSLLLIVLAAAIVGGGTMALFTASEAGEDNTVAAGNVDLTISGSLADGINLSNMAPGDTTTETLFVQNTGSLSFWFAGYISWREQSVVGFIDQFDVKVYGYDDYYHNEEVLLYEGKLGDLYTRENAMIEAEFDPLPTNRWAKYKFEITLPLEIDNTYADASLSAKLTVAAVQSDNLTFDQVKTWLTTGVDPD